MNSEKNGCGLALYYTAVLIRCGTVASMLMTLAQLSLKPTWLLLCKFASLCEHTLTHCKYIIIIIILNISWCWQTIFIFHFHSTSFFEAFHPVFGLLMSACSDRRQWLLKVMARENGSIRYKVTQERTKATMCYPYSPIKLAAKFPQMKRLEYPNVTVFNAEWIKKL